MKIEYDSDADALYISLIEGDLDETKEIDSSTLIDYDKYGRVIGIEILFVKETYPEIMKSLQAENIATAK